MKVPIIALLVLLWGFPVYSQYEIDLSNPEAVAKAVIHSAANEDLEILYAICDPVDYSQKPHVCELPSTGDKEAIHNFSLYIGSARITGAAVFSQCQDHRCATVPFSYTGEGGEETVGYFELVERYGNWYLGTMPN